MANLVRERTTKEASFGGCRSDFQLQGREITLSGERIAFRRHEAGDSAARLLEP